MQPQLDGYSVGALIRSSYGLRVYDGVRNSDRLPVMLELVDVAGDAAAEARLEHEFNQLHALKVDGAVRALALRRAGSEMALVFERAPGVNLAALRGSRYLPARKVLDIAIPVTRVLAALHGQRLIHRDLRPTSVAVDRATGGVTIAEFGISLVREREQRKLYDPRILAEVLPYIAPEQSGRVGRDVDLRSDLYALGVILYELLTGGVPFASDDPLELIHAHLARVPEPPHLVNPEVPVALSNVVSKLLEKAPEARYQSARGLEADLRRCRDALEHGPEIPLFVMGQGDVPETIQFSHRLYGREAEMAAIQLVFAQVAQGSSELVLLRGSAGVGKTALVHAIQKPLSARAGYFAAGKFDPYRDVPYAGFVEAFSGLVDQLLTESDERLARWRAELTSATASLSRVIADLVPSYEFLVDDLSAVPELGARESHNRITLALRRFVGVFARPEHPLVLFLDDLQWADASSVELMEALLSSPESTALLIIGAYRDTEIDESHRLAAMLEHLEERDPRPHALTLGPLGAADVRALLADALGKSGGDLPRLAALVSKKTGNNPFFVRQFLRHLAQSGELAFEPGVGWTWDLEAIERAGIPDDAVEMMTRKIQGLPARTRRVLEVASCTGDTLPAELAAAAADCSLREAVEALYELCDEGLLAESGGQYRFAHDRIREAAHALIALEERPTIHLLIGRYLLEHSHDADLWESIFDIVDQLNFALPLLTDETERLRIAQLNFVAGRRALEAAAYSAAYTRLEAGRQILGDAHWDTHFDLAYGLHLDTARCALYLGKHTEAEQQFDALMARKLPRRLTAQVVAYRIDTYANLNQLRKAVQTAIDGLRHYGTQLHARPSRGAIWAEVARARLHLGARRIGELVDAPPMQDGDQKDQMAILMNLAPVLYTSGNVELLTLVSARMVNASLRYGNDDASAYAYASFGMILGSVFDDYKTGYALGQLALALNDRLQNAKLRGRIQMIVASFVSHWRRPLASCHAFLADAEQASVEVGDLIYAGWSAFHMLSHMVLVGEKLDVIDNKIDRYLEYLQWTGDVDRLETVRITQRLVRILRGRTISADTLDGGGFDERAFLTRTTTNGFVTGICWLYIAKLIAAYLDRDYDRAIAVGESVLEHADGLLGTPHVAEASFFLALAVAAALRTEDGRRDRSRRRLAARMLARLDRWAELCPANYRHKQLLVRAELARADGRGAPGVPADLYDRAIRSAREYGVLHHAALASELAGDFWMDRRRPMIAGPYLLTACEGWQRWGAHRKLDQLRALYPDVVAAFLPERSPSGAIPASPRAGRQVTTIGDVDLATVIKATQVISEQVRLHDVIEQVMALAVENAGAQRGLLLLDRGGAIGAVAEHVLDRGLERFEPPLPLSACKRRLAVTAVRYAIHSGEAVVLDNAAHSGRFGADPYVVRTSARSVLCMPILKQSQRIGILYLENNLIPHAFTSDRLEVLRTLAAQAAISLENAALYDALEQREEQWRSLVDNAPDYILLVDRDRRIQFANRTPLGAMPDDWRGRPVDVLAAERYRGLVRDNVDHVFATGKHASFDCVAETAGGDRWITCRLGPMLLDDEVTGVTIIATDITDKRRAEEQRRQLEAQLRHQQKLESIGTLASGVAHEVNNPIQGILGYAQLILRGAGTPPDVRTFTEEIIHGIERIASIVRNLLTFARHEGEGHAPIDVDRAVHSTLSLIVTVLRRDGIQLEVDIPAGVPRARGNLQQIQQVIMNLVTNARDAVNERYPTDSPDKHIRVTARALDDAGQSWVRIAVEDNGTGIAPEVAQRMFDPFFTTKEEGSGTGLGLSISHGIVAEHHGRLTVESEPGVYTRFLVDLRAAGDCASAATAEVERRVAAGED